MQRSDIHRVLLVCLVSLCGCGNQDSSPGQDEGTGSGRPTPPPPADAVMVGPDACEECHPRRTREARETTHFSTSRIPAEGDMLGDFEEGGNRLNTRNPDLHYLLTRENGGWFQTAVSTGGSRRESIDLVVGSGKLFEGFLYWRDGALFQLPVGHLTPLDKWNNSPGYVDGRADFDRAVEPRCLDCHATRFNHVPGTPNHYDPHNFMAGVTCERCHGPASAHVSWHQTNPSAKNARYIVAPSELSRERRLDQCGQCHGDPGHLLKPAFTYVPGQILSDYVEQAEGDAGESFVHTANQVQRLQLSECFTKSGTLECITCHNPHRFERDRIVQKTLDQCARCHNDRSCTLGPSLHDDVKNDCVACHMPKKSAVETTFSTDTGDYLDLIRLTEHRIAVHADASDEHLVRLNHARGSVNTGDLRRSLLSRFIAQSDERVNNRHFLGAISLLRRARDLGGDNATIGQKLDRALDGQRKRERGDTLVIQGKVHLDAHRDEEARLVLRQAAQIDPLSHDAWYNLGVALEGLDKVGEAADAYRQALASNPQHVDALNNLGSVLAARGDPVVAAALFERAVSLSSGHLGARLNLGRALSAAGKHEQALTHLRLALEARGVDPEIRIEIALSLASLGQLDQAEREIRSALELSGESPALHRELGRIQVAGKKHDKAILSLERALELDPENTATLLAMGDLEMIRSRHDRAIGHLEEVLNLSPGNQRAHMILAFALTHHPDVTRRDPAKAVRLADVIRLGQEELSPDTKRQLVVIYTAGGRPDIAALLR